MILSNECIQGRVESGGMISPFNIDQLNGASYDVRLNDSIIVMGDTSLEGRQPQKIPKEGHPLMPGDFTLAATMEDFDLPNDITAQFALKSSGARRGLEHAMAGFCDPGWKGKLTLELKNIGHDIIVLKLGMRIGQMIFFQMTKHTTRPYKGKYHNIFEVSASRQQVKGEL